MRHLIPFAVFGGFYLASRLGYLPPEIGTIAAGFALTLVGVWASVKLFGFLVRLLPPAWQRWLLCERLHLHNGPLENHGPYTYINCVRCGGLHTPMPRYYAEARFGGEG